MITDDPIRELERQLATPPPVRAAPKPAGACNSSTVAYSATGAWQPA